MQENKPQSKSRIPASVIYIIFFAGLGIIGMQLTSDSVISDLIPVSTTKTTYNTHEKKQSIECTPGEETTFYFEDGKIVYPDRKSDCLDEQIANQFVTDLIGNSESLVSNKTPSDVFNEIGEYQIRESLNQHSELTAQIESVKPVAFTHDIESFYTLTVEIETLEQGVLPYSLRLVYINNTWTVLQASSI